MRPQADDYPKHIERAIRAFLSEGEGAGRQALAPIAYPRREMPRRRSVPRHMRGEIFQRDNFHCRYCEGKVIPTPIMELLAFVYEDIFPSHSNWKGGLTHPAFIARSPLVDHVQPVSAGGDLLDPENLVTACNPCNAIKAELTLEQLGWTVRPIVRSEWDGLTSLYGALWERTGRPAADYHVAWMAALGRGDPA